MTNVTFNKKEFEKLLGKNLDKEVQDKISLFGTPLESVSQEEIEIEIFPNRPDLISLQGYIRSFKAFLGKETGLKKYKSQKSNKKLIVDKSIPKEWPYAYACIIKGLKFDDEKIKEIIQVQEKLGTTLLRNRKKGGIGLYPLEKIKFPVTFKGLEPNKIKFRPLEYPKEITGRQILSKHPTGRTYAHIVKSWKNFPVFVDKNNTIMSMPPIINSHNLGKIDKTTTDIFLEATGTDPEILKKALNIVALTLADMGGKIQTLECQQQNNSKEEIPNLSPQKTKISLENINKLLGLELKEKDIKKYLDKMGHEYKNGSVLSPAWRTDILHEVDLIEDIAIAYGYENFIPEIPQTATIGEESKTSKLIRKISEILIGLNLIEISSYHLIKAEEAKKAKIQDGIELENSKTEYKILRPNLLIPALRILAENKDNEYPQNIFEIGTIFESSKNNETGIEEKTNLLIALAPGNFTQAKQHLDYLFRSLDQEYALKESTHPQLIEGRTGSILLEEKEIGYIGEVSPQTLQTWNNKMPLAIIELNLDEILDKVN